MYDLFVIVSEDSVASVLLLRQKGPVFVVDIW
jgi:hypothetical protein